MEKKVISKKATYKESLSQSNLLKLMASKQLNQYTVKLKET